VNLPKPEGKIKIDEKTYNEAIQRIKDKWKKYFA